MSQGLRATALPARTTASAKEIRLGLSSIDVSAVHRGATYTTTVTRRARLALTIGAVLPRGTAVASATLDGRPVTPKLVPTARGLEARVSVGPGRGSSVLVLTART